MLYKNGPVPKSQFLEVRSLTPEPDCGPLAKMQDSNYIRLNNTMSTLPSPHRI